MLQDTGKKKSNNTYHHGNLKQALVDAYLELLETLPAEKLSLRRVAKQVGVAPTAVYNHFADKTELLIAVLLRCLRHFTDYLEKHSNYELQPEERIKNLGIAYFQYSVDHACYFDLILQGEVPEEYVNDEVLETSMAAESELRAAVTALYKKHGIKNNLYNEGLGAFSCWAMAHGISGLARKHINHTACMSGRWPPEFTLHNRESVEKSFGAMADVLVAGLLAQARKG